MWRLQLTLPDCIKINGKTGTHPWILNTKYIIWKQDFRAIKEQWTNKTSNVSDLISEPEGEEDVSDTDTDSDITDDEENSSGSAGEESQNFLDNILTAARPWSTNGR